jgi:hypothetical protein
MMKPRVLMLWVIAALAACHHDSGQPPKPSTAAKARAPVAAPRGPTPEEMTTGMVEAASQGKSQLPVALKFDLLQRPAVGQPLEIALALVPQVAASAARIEVAGLDGLQVADGDSKIEVPALDANQVYRHSIRLTPAAEGVLLLNLNVTLKREELSDSRVFSVPIIVAAAPGGAAPPKK